MRDWRDHRSPGLAPLLDRAAALANQGLFFEVHELLEPGWFRAAEPERTALQGLIQVAVGFHHLENGNRDGGRSLLALGVAKLSQAGSALPLDLAGWLPRLREALARVRERRRRADAAALARPAVIAAPARCAGGSKEARWRSC